MVFENGYATIIMRRPVAEVGAVVDSKLHIKFIDSVFLVVSIMAMTLLSEYDGGSHVGTKIAKSILKDLLCF